MNEKDFPRYYQDSTGQLQIKLISANKQSVVRAFVCGEYNDYMTAMEPVKMFDVAKLESNYVKSNETIYLQKLDQVLKHYEKVRNALAAQLAT